MISGLGRSTTFDYSSFCAEILPEVLSLDEWGFPFVGDGVFKAAFCALHDKPCGLVRSGADVD